MLLGGSRYALPVIKTAHDLGVYVITCDYLPNNIAHKYSDQYCNISVIDKEAVLRTAKELQIDGIMSFACDPGVVTAAYVAEKMGLPSCGSYEAVSILQNKAKFRQFLRDNGFNVPKTHTYTSVEDIFKDRDNISYPVIVKPVDSAGSKGVSLADNLDKLTSAAQFAFEYSFKNQIVVEEYIKEIGFPSDTDCFSIDGKLEFISFNCQRFDEYVENPYAPVAYSWPSTLPESVKSELAQELQRAISLLNLNTSIFNIETRLGADGKPYIMELSPRGGGNRLAECIKYATGVDLIEGAVKAALGMKIDCVSQKPYSGYWAEVVLHSQTAGKYIDLFISDEIVGNVVETDVWVSKGDAVYGFDSANKAIGTLIMSFPNKAIMEKVMSNISQYINVIIE